MNPFAGVFASLMSRINTMSWGGLRAPRFEGVYPRRVGVGTYTKGFDRETGKDLVHEAPLMRMRDGTVYLARPDGWRRYGRAEK